MPQKIRKEKHIVEMPKEINNMNTCLVPLKSIGDFYFDSPISIYTEKYNFEYSPVDDLIGWEGYSLENKGIDISVEDGIIVSIDCEKECFYKGQNIIGMNINDFMNTYDVRFDGKIDTLYVSNIDNETQDVYEFDEIGLQIWCSNDIIVSVIADSGR